MPIVTTETGLNEKQTKFCEEYLIDFNGAQAAIRAGYSVKTARQMATENLSKPYIEAYLKKRLDELKNETGITQKRVLEEYAKIAFFDIRKAYNVDGGLKGPREFDDETAGVIASLESYEERVDDGDGEKIVAGTTKKIKLHDKIRALDSLGRHLGIFEKDNKQREIQIPVINVHNGD